MENMENQRKIKLFAFDANGTIFDDTVSFWKAINGIFPRFGKESLSSEVLKEKFGQPWTKIYRDNGISEETASDQKLYEIYNELYTNEDAPRLFDDVELVLGWLKEKGIILAIVSTQQNSITERLLKHYGLENLFTCLEGGVSDKSEALKGLFKKLNVLPEEAAYMGDQEGDILHAKKAGCNSVGFCGGLHDLERLSKVKPDFLIHNYQGIKEIPIF